MPFPLPHPPLRPLDGRMWRLEEPLLYQGARDWLLVPDGYETDLASVPRAATWLVPTYGVYTPAAILHDWLCDNPRLMPRRDADGLFRRHLRELGVFWPRRWAMWAAVRFGSRLTGARPVEVAQVFAVSLVALVTVLPPILLVQLCLSAVTGVEKLWAAGE